MKINYLFTNDYDYLNNFTTFIPKHQRPVQGKNKGNNQMNNNEIRPQPLIDAKIYSLRK